MVNLIGTEFNHVEYNCQTRSSNCGSKWELLKIIEETPLFFKCEILYSSEGKINVSEKRYMDKYLVYQSLKFEI